MKKNFLLLAIMVGFIGIIIGGFSTVGIIFLLLLKKDSVYNTKNNIYQFFFGKDKAYNEIVISD